MLERAQRACDAATGVGGKAVRADEAVEILDGRRGQLDAGHPVYSSSSETL